MVRSGHALLLRLPLPPTFPDDSIFVDVNAPLIPRPSRPLILQKLLDFLGVVFFSPGLRALSAPFWGLRVPPTFLPFSFLALVVPSLRFLSSFLSFFRMLSSANGCSRQIPLLSFNVFSPFVFFDVMNRSVTADFFPYEHH